MLLLSRSGKYLHAPVTGCKICSVSLGKPQKSYFFLVAQPLTPQPLELIGHISFLRFFFKLLIKFFILGGPALTPSPPLLVDLFMRLPNSHDKYLIFFFFVFYQWVGQGHGSKCPLKIQLGRFSSLYD